MTPKNNIPNFSIWEKAIYFFPVQLLFVHLKKNVLLLGFWVILFAIITKSFGLKYGVPYLFLYPEYLGQVGFLSHCIVGLSAGAFIMAFNISSYTVNGFRFPFLATLNRPFIKYCQNNFIIPISFSVAYLFTAASFQMIHEEETLSQVIQNMSGFLAGNVLFILMTAAYFSLTNKSAMFFRNKNTVVDKNFINPISDLFSNSRKWEHIQGKNKKEWKVATYIAAFGKIKIARDSSHYLKSTLEKVFQQNRINASLFQVSIIVVIFILGFLSNFDWIMIPSAASILLLFTMFIMLVSAFYSWFKGWTSLVLLTLIVALNLLSTQSTSVYKNQAYGLDYDRVPAQYSIDQISSMQLDSSQIRRDVNLGIERLENWKQQTGEEKPLAVFLNVPGGGLRSAIWTMKSVATANESTNGQLWENLVLISGSSGGMIGASYLREVLNPVNKPISLEDAYNDMSKDKLNPVAATAVLNDVFFRFKSFQYQGKSYTRDRAKSFEEKLSTDTRGLLNKTLSQYFEREQSAKTPMLLLSPTISNDGRKLLISPLPISYLGEIRSRKETNENIEFTQFFKNHDPGNLSFLSALRMSATFPYVFPSANLPTKPEIEILDAGIRDNYGMTSTLRYIKTFRDWMSSNTSGIVIIQIRDQQKLQVDDPNKKKSLFESITQPFGTFYNTILNVQDYQLDDQIRMAGNWYEDDIEIIDLVLERSELNPISLSWHLTKKEKSRITDALQTTHNQYQFTYLKRLLNPEE
jgi:hypothetical protein